MALTFTLSTAAKTALAARLADPSSALFQPKYIVFVDAAATPVRFVADVTTITAAANVDTIIATGTCPAGVTTPLGGQAAPADASTAYAIAYLIGDVGTYSIASQDDAETLAAGAYATFANYVIGTIVTGAAGDRLAVTAADAVKVTSATVTF